MEKKTGMVDPDILPASADEADCRPVRLRRRRNAVANIYLDLGSVEIRQLHQIRCEGCSRLEDCGDNPCESFDSCSAVSFRTPSSYDSVNAESCDGGAGAAGASGTSSARASALSEVDVESQPVVPCARHRKRRNGLANIFDPQNTGRVMRNIYSGENHFY